MTEKADGAFRTIGELSSELGVPQHILRYWETRFPELRPLTRAGNRRYYRVEDIALVRRIHSLLYGEGYTIKGVQKVLSGKGTVVATPTPSIMQTQPDRRVDTPIASVTELKAIRNRLAAALAA
jgi:DNA-binding transcriptional MerR regulator